MKNSLLPHDTASGVYLFTGVLMSRGLVAGKVREGRKSAPRAEKLLKNTVLNRAFWCILSKL